jgi:poly-beta-hydroxyalkanoate depolymerase
MIWAVKIGDIIELSNDVYHYEVTDVYRNWAILKNQLTHETKDIRISKIKEVAKVIRRND